MVPLLSMGVLEHSHRNFSYFMLKCVHFGRLMISLWFPVVSSSITMCAVNWLHYCGVSFLDAKWSSCLIPADGSKNLAKFSRSWSPLLQLLTLDCVAGFVKFYKWAWRQVGGLCTPHPAHVPSNPPWLVH